MFKNSARQNFSKLIRRSWTICEKNCGMYYTHGQILSWRHIFVHSFRTFRKDIVIFFDICLVNRKCRRCAVLQFNFIFWCWIIEKNAKTNLTDLKNCVSSYFQRVTLYSFFLKMYNVQVYYHSCQEKRTTTLSKRT